MNRKEIKKMIMAILKIADYDLSKGFDPKTAEEPEYAVKEMERLIDIAEKHLKKSESKTRDLLTRLAVR